MITRRKFITNTLSGTAAASLIPMGLVAKTHKSKLKNFGYISGVLKNEFASGDWKVILKKTTEMGYTEYEGGIQGDSSKDFIAYLNDIGMEYIAGGIGMTDDMEKAKLKFDELKGMGAKYAVCYWPWFVGAPFKLEDCKKSAPILNKLGELAKERDLGFCWHNHDKEFLQMGNNQLPFDFVMENTDKEVVKVELDIYWVEKGNADCVQILKKYPGRVKIMHVKDMVDKESEDFACPGSGIIDFASIFAEAKKQGIQHYFVERDNEQHGLDCLRSSAEYLKNLNF